MNRRTSVRSITMRRKKRMRRTTRKKSLGGEH